MHAFYNGFFLFQILTKLTVIIFFLAILLFSSLYADEKNSFTPSGLKWVDDMTRFLQKMEGKIPQPLQVVSVLNITTIEYYQDEKRHEAIELAEQTWQYAKKQLGEQHQETLIALSNLKLLGKTLDNQIDTEQQSQHALHMDEQILGKDNPNNSAIINNFTDVYKAQGRYDEIDSSYQRTFCGREQNLDKAHLDTLARIDKLAGLYESQGRYDKAESLYQHIVHINEQVLCEEHPDIAISVNNLAFFYQTRGRYDEAEPLFLRALRINEQVLGEAHPNTLGSLNNLASLYQAQGRYNEAEPLYQRVLNLCEKMLGKKHSQTLTSVSNLAYLYYIQGRYGEAEPLFQRALQVREQVLGKTHPHTLRSVNKLGMLYTLQDRYDEAEPLLQRAVRMNKQVLGKAHPRTLASVNNLAHLYICQGHYAEAEPLFQNVLQTNKQVLGTAHPQTLGSINNLANLYEVQGRYDKAKPLYEQALHTREQALGKTHPSTLSSINNLASMYRSQGQYGKAEPLLQHALPISEQVLGKSHPLTMAIMLNLIDVYLRQQQDKSTLELLKRLQISVLKYAMVELSFTLGETQKRHFLTKQSILQDLALVLALQHPQPDNQNFATTALLRWTQVQGEEVLYLQHLIRHPNSLKIQELGKKIRDEREKLSFIANTPNANPKLLQTSLDNLAQLEVQLSQQSWKFKQHLAIRNLDLDDVRKALPSNSALLALKIYRPIDIEKSHLQSPHYAALLLPADEERDLQLHDLGSVDSIKADKDPTSLYQRLFGTWDKQLASYQSLYIIPDHWLHLVNFESLKLPDGRYWIQRQALHRLQTARDLLRSPPKQQGKGLLALGNIDYGYHDEKIASSSLNDFQRNLAEQNISFNPLPASNREVKQIASYYNFLHDNNKQVWLGQEATEHRLKQLTQPPKILHLATHGFYLEDRHQLQRPLALSGLALANANLGIHGQRDEDGEDGILYAMEVQDLNLEGTLLVTLSACDTGKGVVDYAEGVYGLIRAFRLAGARHIIMTLRPINDEYASLFMRTFYKVWLASDNLDNLAAMLRATKLAFINDDKGYEPEVWAPYVLVEMP